MGDILIRGMEMPKEGYLPLNIYPDGRVSCNLDYDCARAVPLPEGHGRLIDADALIASFRESVQECKKISEDGYADALQEVNERAILATFIEAILRTKAQPTIIEAEGVKEDG